MREGERDAADQRRADQVGGDHQPAPGADAIEPDAGRQREEQVRQQPDRGQRPHLGRVGAEGEHGDQRQSELGDLVAEDGDRLAEPEPPEIGCVEEERRDVGAEARARTQPRSGGRDVAADGSGRRVVLLLGQLLLDFLVDLVLAVLPHAPDHVQPEEPRPDEGHDQPDEESTAPSWASTVSRRPVIQYTSRNASTPRMIPVIRRIIVARPSIPRAAPHVRRSARRLSLGVTGRGASICARA